MLKNHIKIAVRRLIKDKFYALINIIGLAVGLTSFLFILIYIQDELNYDRFHEKADQIYRVGFTAKMGESEFDIAEAGDIVGPHMLATFPEVKAYTRMRERGSWLIRYEEETYKEEDVIFADSTLFDVFSFELLEGEAEEALVAPNSIVISRELALKYFNEIEGSVGKILTLDNEDKYTVTGVMEEIPTNSHFRTQVFCSLSTLEESRRNIWSSMNFYTYLVIQEGADIAALEAKFPQMIKDHMGRELEAFLGVSFDDFLAAGSYANMSLFPMTDIHLHSHKMDELGPNGDIKYVYIFTFIGIFILLIACINFMNLATARSAKRAREVGIRKVVGAERRQLIYQFIGESTILTFIALILAFISVQWLLPLFNNLSAKEFSHATFFQPWVILSAIGLMLIVGFISGSYPAFFLSAFKPVKVIKGTLGLGGKGTYLRNGLVVFQFVITSILIVGTLIMFNQLSYIQNKKLGFEKDQVLLLEDAYALGNNLNAFKEEIQKDPQVEKASITSYLPTPSSRNSSTYFLGRSAESSNSQIVQHWYVDKDYVPTFSMNIREGRNFNENFGTDSLAIIINEAAVRIFGIEDPVGKELSSFFGGDSPENMSIRTYHIVGVVEDFHYSSLRDVIAPLVLHMGRSRQYMAMRVKTSDLQDFTGRLEAKWREMAPYQPFKYTFLDEGFASTYETELRLGRITGTFAFLAIFIACMGLLGLATFTAEQRTKEIAVRKVLGASISNLFMLLTSEFTKWVLIANVIALPIAYLLMDRWLEGFAYQTTIHVGTLALALMTGILIAIATVCYQSFKASYANPVTSLKYE